MRLTAFRVVALMVGLSVFLDRGVLAQAGAGAGTGTVPGTGSRTGAAPGASAPPLKAGSIASHTGWPEPKPADVRTVDSIVAALYGAISAPAGQERDWNRFKSLFAPDAKLIPIRVLSGSPDSKNPSTDSVYMSLEEYVARATATMTKAGFFERAVHNEVHEFGALVDVFSTYESRRAVEDAKPFARGINSIQLMKDGERYWILNVTWDAERATNPIPARYLPASAAASTPGALNANFNGSWVGQLEYRDFQTNQQVFLPTWLTLTPDADGRSVHLSYVYDDGPTKTVRESSTLAFAVDTSKATLTSDRDKTSDSFDVQGLTEFSKTGRGVLTLTGKSKENDKPVDVRITLALRRNLYTFRKETKQVGEEFRFRDAYTFTRAEPPAF